MAQNMAQKKNRKPSFRENTQFETDEDFQEYVLEKFSVDVTHVNFYALHNVVSKSLRILITQGFKAFYFLSKTQDNAYKSMYLGLNLGLNWGYII